MRTAISLCGALLTLSLVGCYNPALPDQPFWCGPGGKCPDGYGCYGGICGKSAPDCLTQADPQYAGWPNDNDLEPNNHPELAVTLPCGSNPNPAVDPTYPTRCPSRANLTNGFMNLVVCPARDRDMYKIYLLPNESVVFQIIYQYSENPPRNLDAKVWRWDFILNDYVQVAVGQSTNDNETIPVSTETSTGNPEGWYFLEVYGATDQDVNFYTVSFTLNPP
jgi:hypothetical protein